MLLHDGHVDPHWACSSLKGIQRGPGRAPSCRRPWSLNRNDPWGRRGSPSPRGLANSVRHQEQALRPGDHASRRPGFDASRRSICLREGGSRDPITWRPPGHVIGVDSSLRSVGFWRSARFWFFGDELLSRTAACRRQRCARPRSPLFVAYSASNRVFSILILMSGYWRSAAPSTAPVGFHPN